MAIPLGVRKMRDGLHNRYLVLGVNGQDGSYIAENLLSQGVKVVGIGRQEESKWIGKIDGFSYYSLNLNDIQAYCDFLQDYRPTVIFHLAAVHGAADFSYENHWLDAHKVNTLVTHASLEYMRREMLEGILVYASSSKVFGSEPPTSISEASERKSTCIYSVTKNASTDLIHYYRSRYGIRGSVVWAFNHESPRRSRSFFIPTVVDILAHSILDNSYRGGIGSLRFWCDWGDAEEFMAIIVEIAHKAAGQDFILGTGTTLWANHVVDQLFSRYRLTANEHIDERIILPIDKPPRWAVDLSRLNNVLARVPRRTIYDVCDDILRVNYSKAWAASRRDHSIPPRLFL